MCCNAIIFLWCESVDIVLAGSVRNLGWHHIDLCNYNTRHHHILEPYSLNDCETNRGH